jgi:opine dehydrogenase
MYGRDFAAENELLNALDMQRHDIRDLQRAARTGLLQR